MWVCLSDSFLSIVKKDCAGDELLVRARRKGDIERVFPDAKVIRTPKGDYLYRAVVSRLEVVFRIERQISAIDYDNFKDSVEDKPLHDAYLRVWSAMASVQPTEPYTGKRRRAQRTA